MTEKSELKILLSCDSVDDAIRSLALFYDLNFKDVEKVFHSSWPDFLNKESDFHEFRDDRLAWCLGQYLQAKNMRQDIDACFYHRSRFDGNSNWFEDGLLDNSAGVVSFFSKLRKMDGWLTNWDAAESISLNNVSDRDLNSAMQGPHAFDVLDEAKSACKNGLDYSQPEFLMGGSWSKFQELNTAVVTFIQKLQPVIVKFRAAPESTDRYINHLWMYLHASKFNLQYGDPHMYSFCGKGIAVPRTDIVELIKIN
jgi:hypothetical protein